MIYLDFFGQSLITKHVSIHHSSFHSFFIYKYKRYDERVGIKHVISSDTWINTINHWRYIPLFVNTNEVFHPILHGLG